MAITCKFFSVDTWWPELDFTTMENLKKAIHDDIDVSRKLLDEPLYKGFQTGLDNHKM